MLGVEIHNLIDTVTAILYYTSNKNAENIYKQSLKKGLTEEEALVENKVKLVEPFLKSGTNMKFYEGIFTICLGFLITISALKFGPIVNISLLVSAIGAAFYISVRLFR